VRRASGRAARVRTGGRARREGLCERACKIFIDRRDALTQRRPRASCCCPHVLTRAPAQQPVVRAGCRLRRQLRVWRRSPGRT
jgi:hypothetical protein